MTGTGAGAADKGAETPAEPEQPGHYAELEAEPGPAYIPGVEAGPGPINIFFGSAYLDALVVSISNV